MQRRTLRLSHALRAKLNLGLIYVRIPLSDCFVDMHNLSRCKYIKKVRKKRIKRFTGLARGHIINQQLRRTRIIVRFCLLQLHQSKTILPGYAG